MGYPCTGLKVSITNSLLTTHPELLAEFDKTKNSVAFDQLTAGSRKKVCGNVKKVVIIRGTRLVIELAEQAVPLYWSKISITNSTDHPSRIIGRI